MNPVVRTHQRTYTAGLGNCFGLPIIHSLTRQLVEHRTWKLFITCHSLCSSSTRSRQSEWHPRCDPPAKRVLSQDSSPTIATVVISIGWSDYCVAMRTTCQRDGKTFSRTPVQNPVVLSAELRQWDQVNETKSARLSQLESGPFRVVRALLLEHTVRWFEGHREVSKSKRR